MSTSFIINHLWQSSCFALLAGLLAFVLRKNSPKVGYWVWLSASVKFLVPFALLMNLGNSLWTAFAAKKIASELAGIRERELRCHPTGLN